MKLQIAFGILAGFALALLVLLGYWIYDDPKGATMFIGILIAVNVFIWAAGTIAQEYFD